jgi:hypothetical protein
VARQALQLRDITLDDEGVDMVAGGYDAAIRIGEVIEQDMVAISTR